MCVLLHFIYYDVNILQPTYYNPEEGGSMFLWNVGIRQQDYMAVQPRRPRSEWILLPELSSFQVEIAIEKLKGINLQDMDQWWALWTQDWTFGCHKKQWISWQAEQLFTSQ
jgi:hypothetical protein